MNSVDYGPEPSSLLAGQTDNDGDRAEIIRVPKLGQVYREGQPLILDDLVVYVQ